LENRLVLAVISVIAPALVWFMSLFVPGRSPAIMARECRNKCRVMTWVQRHRSYIDLFGSKAPALIVDEIYAADPFGGLWIFEGLGKDVFEAGLIRSPLMDGLLAARAPADPRGDPRFMLYAGMGIGIARKAIKKLDRGGDEQSLIRAVSGVLAQCDELAPSGYVGAAVESLGLASRFMRDADFCRRVQGVLAVSRPSALPFFWHGVGRAIYFHPLTFLPTGRTALPAVDLCRREAPNAEAESSMLAGVAWAATLVNMSCPEVGEWILRDWPTDQREKEPLVAGVLSAVAMRCATAPMDENVAIAIRHRSTDRAAVWQAFVQAPFVAARERLCPSLLRRGNLDEVFGASSRRVLAEAAGEDCWPLE